MAYEFRQQIEFLLAYACPGIRYLVHRDLLGTPSDEPFMASLREEILLQSNTQKILAAQHPDGWFGHELHGIDGMDCLIGGLLNLGVEADHPAIHSDVNALLTPGISSAHKNWFRGGAALDAEGRGGNRAVRANILAMTKSPENIPVYAAELALAFEHLSSVLNYSSIDDFTVRGKSGRYYKTHARFPGANHLGILAAAQGWRTEETMRTAKSAVTRAYEIMKDTDEFITFRKPQEFGGGFVGPFNYNWQALSPLSEEQILGIMNSSYSFGFAFWLSSVSSVPDWVRQHNGSYDALASLLEKNKIPANLSEKALGAFRKVSGREPNYRKKHAAECDVLFAVLNAVWGKV